MLKIISKSGEDTIKTGERLAKYLFPGSIVCLLGDLGAGKTAFTQGLGKGLGIVEHITSPTYTIINEYYSGRIPLYHFDVYRLGSSDEMFELGCDEYFYGDGVTVLEWADNVYDILPPHRLWIKITLGANPEERNIEMEAQGNIYDAILKEMEKNENISH